MFLQLVQIEANEPPVGNGSIELLASDGLLETSFVGLKKGSAALLGEKYAFGPTAEVAGLQGTTIQQGEDHAIHDNGFKDLGYVEIEGVAALIGRVQEADPRVEVGTVDFTQHRHVQEAVTERHECVDPVPRRPAGALAKPEVLALQDKTPPLVIKLAASAFKRHQLRGCGR